MDLKQLQTFELVARYGSISRAARVLEVAQPTITARIQTLEQELGATLFNRGRHRVTLSHYGRTYLQYVRRAMDALNEGRIVAEEAVSGERGSLTIGTLPTFADGIFTDALWQFRQVYPNVNVMVHTGHNAQVIEMLYDAQVDVGFVTTPVYTTDLIEMHRLEDPLIWVAPPEHPLSDRDSVAVTDLGASDRPLIVVDWSIESKMHQLQIQADAPSSTGQWELPPQAAYAAISQGYGIALLTRSMVLNDLRVGRLVELHVEGVEPLSRTIAMVCKPDGAQNRVTTEFLRLFQSHGSVNNPSPRTSTTGRQP